MSDTKRMTADEQLGAFAGCRVTVCRCVGCRINFLSLHSHAKWCSAGCRKAAYKDRKATGAVTPVRRVKPAPPMSAVGVARCGAHVGVQLVGGRCPACDAERVTLHDLGLSELPVGVTIEEAAQHVVFSAPGRCVHCNGKVRLRSNDAICGMCGLNFDGA